MLRTTVQNSKTFLRPQLQLFAEPAPQVNPDKNPNNQIPPPADPPGGGTEPNLPKTQEELDALINTRLKRAEKDWLKKQKQAQQPPAAPPSASHAEGEGEPAEDNSAALHREIVETRAQLAAYKEGIKPEAVEDAVLLAMHAVEKSGDELDEDAVAEALAGRRASTPTAPRTAFVCPSSGTNPRRTVFMPRESTTAHPSTAVPSSTAGPGRSTAISPTPCPIRTACL